MTLYDKFINKIPIKIVGIWKDQFWMKYNLQEVFEQIGEIECVYVPKDRIKNHTSFANQIYNTVEKIKPDLVFSYVNGRHAIAEPFLKIKELNIPTVNMYLDDANKFKLIKPLAHSFTLNLTCTKYSIPHYEQNNAKVLYLPEGANPNYYIRQDVKKDIDISFVGGKYGNRLNVIQALRSKGYKVEVKGKGWAGGKASFKDMISLYNKAKIVIGFARSSSQSEIKSIKGRDFEATMCGAFYLCENNPELCDWFESDKEIVFWNDIPDLVEKTEYYLKNDSIRKTIAKASYTRAITEHTCMNRIKNLFKYMSETFGV